jgi:alpha-amylase/alpha-mannosidase (GH57 family)
LTNPPQSAIFTPMEKKEPPRRPARGLFWANLLHFYQPPDQDRTIVEKVVNESYLPVLRMFEQIPTAKATINISGCLIDLLIRTGFGEIVTRLKKLAESGQIEFTVTPRFHPFLPFTHEEEIDRQIAANDKIGKRYFGMYYAPRGFYSPEMAYETTVAKTAVRRVCRWLAIDEIAITGNLGQLQQDKLYMDKSAGGLLLVPRDRRLSEALADSIFSRDKIKSAADFLNLAGNHNRKFIFTAGDVEHFGHHRKDHHNILRMLYKDSGLISVTVSELTNHIRKKEYCKPKACDWTTSPEDIKNKRIFFTWNDPGNKIHKTLWELYRMAFDEIRNAAQSGDIMHNRSRDMLGAAVPSCSFFWASCRPWWYGVYPENAATGICLALFSLLAPSPKVKDKAFKLRQNIYDMVAEFNQAGVARKQQINYLKSRGIDTREFYERFKG